MFKKDGLVLGDEFDQKAEQNAEKNSKEVPE